MLLESRKSAGFQTAFNLYKGFIGSGNCSRRLGQAWGSLSSTYQYSVPTPEWQACGPTETVQAVFSTHAQDVSGNLQVLLNSGQTY